MPPIILEGPDGGGKSTLLRELADTLLLSVAPRASTSKGGPVQNLFAWINNDVHLTWDGPVRLYDRHPLISEYVYGWGVRNGPAQGLQSEKAAKLRQRLYREALVVMCLPPLEQVKANVLQEEQMPGVLENIDKIHGMYSWLTWKWPNPKNLVVYDHTDPSAFYRVRRAVSEYRERNM